MANQILKIRIIFGLKSNFYTLVNWIILVTKEKKSTEMSLVVASENDKDYFLIFLFNNFLAKEGISPV